LQLAKKIIEKRGRKMMLKKFRCLVLAMVLILVVVSSTTFAAKKPVKLVFGSSWEVSHYYVKGDNYFKKLVEKNSKGQILVDYFPAKQLGSIVEQIQAVKSGAQQMTYNAIGEFVSFWPKLATLDLPYLYRDQKHYLKVVERFSSLIEQDEMAAKTGIRIIGARIRAPRQLTTKFPVNKLEDIKGLKIRVPQQPVSVALWKVLGAVPTVLASQVYTALATGTVDAQENPFESIISAKFYEVQKYCALTAHKREIIPIVINNNFWKGLTAAQKKIVQDAVDKSNKFTNKLGLKNENESYKALVKLGMKFTKPDLAPFREKAKVVWKEFGDAKLINKIQKIK
jgi:tripartite ATP-independent transporter DctP family solute receptor